MPEVKSEGAYEENDTVIIEKMDGGQYVTRDAFLETGYLHIPDANWTLKPQTGRKVPVLSFNVSGQPPTQIGLVYYADEEPRDPLSDSWTVNGALPNIYNKAWSGTTRQDLRDRTQKRHANMIFGLIGGFIIVCTLLINSKACGPSIHIIEVEKPAVVEPAIQPSSQYVFPEDMLHDDRKSQG